MTKIRVLPGRPPYVMNRDPILERLEQLARPELAATKLLRAVGGQQGVGKTAFTFELVHRIEPHYEVCLFYAVDASQPGRDITAGNVAEFFLRRLKVPQADIPADDQERFLVLAELLHDPRVLLVLDDVRDAAQVGPLLDIVPADAVLLTSRNSMPSLYGAGFQPLELDMFDRPGARRMVRGMVPERQDVNDDLVRKLHQWSSGLPLALATAVGRLRQPDFTAAEVEILLAEYPERDGDPARAVESMFRTLDDDQARQCAELALIPGTHFDPPTAAAALDVDETTARRVLRALRDACLLLPPAEADQFSFHAMLRRFAREKALGLLTVNERQDVVVRVAEHRWRRLVALDKSISDRPVPVPAHRWYATIEPAYLGPDAVPAAFDELDRGWRNLLDTFDEALKLPHTEVGLLFPLALWYFAFQTARYVEIVQVQDDVLSVAQDPVLRFHLLLDKVASCREDKVVDDAVRQAVALNYRPRMQSLYDLHGNALERRGDYDSALLRFEWSRAAIPDMEDPEQRERASALLDMHIGRVRARLRQIDEARPLLSRAYDYFAAKTREHANRARAGSWLGKITPSWETASLLLSDALSTFLELRMKEEAQETCEWLAAAAESANRREDAELYRQRAQELATQQPRRHRRN